MSSIYIQEPPTDGKVLLVTTVGDIDIELWSKETPKTCRNFIQLCMEGYYDGTIFHRVIPGFIAQGGDPTGTGEGGESIYGKTFKDEFHSRLRFNRRGLLGMANAGRNDNGSQFFFTLGEAGELNNKHSVFGKVTGNTVYNMVKLGEAEIERERPVIPHKVLKTKILHNPFSDIEPRENLKKRDKDENRKKTKSTAKATKDFKLLSFGEEAEEDEVESIAAIETIKQKGTGKSSHELLDDDKLSKIPAVHPETIAEHKRAARKREKSQQSGSDEDEEESLRHKVRQKLQKTDVKSRDFIVGDDSDEDTPTAKSAKIAELQKEARRLRKELLATDKKKDEEEVEEHNSEGEENDLIKAYKAEKMKYKQETIKEKGPGRETDTMSMLQGFQSTLSSVAMMAGLGGGEGEEGGEDEGEVKEEEEQDELEERDITWLSHKLNCAEPEKKALDANVAELNRYELFDPRNPLTMRRREESKKAMKAAASGKR